MLGSRCKTTVDLLLVVFQTCFKLFCIRFINLYIHTYIYIYFPTVNYSPRAVRGFILLGFQYLVVDICFGLILYSLLHSVWACEGLPQCLAFPCLLPFPVCCLWGSGFILLVWASVSMALTSLPAHGLGSSWHIQFNLGTERDTPACELLFLSVALRQCRQLPGTHVSTAVPWCEVRLWQSTAPDWGATVPEAGSDRILVNAPTSSLASQSARC